MKGLRQHTFDLFPLCKCCTAFAGSGLYLLSSILANWPATGRYTLRGSERHDPMEAALAFLNVFVFPLC